MEESSYIYLKMGKTPTPTPHECGAKVGDASALFQKSVNESPENPPGRESNPRGK